jgi:hypothetical protein
MEEYQQIPQGRVPAPQTLEFFKDTNKKFDNMETSMNELTTNVQLMKKDISAICEKLDVNTIEHKEIMGKIDRFIESADTRYASKNFQSNVERVGWAVLLLITGALVASFFRLVLK